MADYELWLIRHAQAEERGPDWPDDARRPLVAKGHKQARTVEASLAALEVTLDRLFSSPFTRAAQTAEPLAARLRKGRRPEYLDALAGGAYPQLLRDLAEACAPDDAVVACVGHEPWLSELASLLLTGDPHRLGVHYRKSAAMLLSGALEPGAMTLELFLPVKVAKRLGG